MAWKLTPAAFSLAIHHNPNNLERKRLLTDGVQIVKSSPPRLISESKLHNNLLVSRWRILGFCDLFALVITSPFPPERFNPPVYKHLLRRVHL